MSMISGIPAAGLYLSSPYCSVDAQTLPRESSEKHLTIAPLNDFPEARFNLVNLFLPVPQKLIPQSLVPTQIPLSLSTKLQST